MEMRFGHGGEMQGMLSTDVVGDDRRWSLLVAFMI